MNLKYSILSIVILIAWNVSAQTAPSNQAVVTIVGDPVQPNINTNDFINTNPYAENSAPSNKQQTIKSPQTIEPTIENGFHMRFEVTSSSQSISHSGGSSYSGYSSSGKTKKHGPSITERSFNAKKRIKSWLPERKKKYHPHLCGRF